MEINNKIYGMIGLVAEDSSDRTKKNFKELSEKLNVPFRIAGTIEDLSQSIGQVNKAVLVIKDENFAKEILKRIDGGEIIG